MLNSTISLKMKVEDSKKYKARVIGDQCFGCSLCVARCKFDAMKFKIVQVLDQMEFLYY